MLQRSSVRVRASPVSSALLGSPFGANTSSSRRSVLLSCSPCQVDLADYGHPGPLVLNVQDAAAVLQLLENV